MSLAAVLTSADVLGALALLALAGAIELPLEHFVQRRVAVNAVLEWCWDHLLAPLARALLVVAFVLLAYPALFGVHHAPEIGVLLADGSLRLTHLVNVLFLASLLLPLLPPFDRRAALVHTVQGLIATAMVFDWYATYLGATSAGSWPGAGPAMLIAAVALAGAHLAEQGGRRLGRALDAARATVGYNRAVPHVAALLGQAPAVVLYGYALGRQIAI